MTQHISPSEYRKLMGHTSGVMIPTQSKVRDSIVKLNKNERNYAHYLEYERMAGHIVAYWSHPFRLKLPGWKQSYQPDFMIQYLPKYAGHPSELELVELKVLWKNKGHESFRVGWQGDAREKFKTAAGTYTCFSWVVRWKDVDLWREERFI